MIARIKGLKISQATERANVTGLEMIPFQDGERNGKIRMIEFKNMTMYVFDPTITDGKISQEDYNALKKAIEEGKLIYTVNADRTGLQLATEVSVDHGNIHMKSPGFKLETDSDNISLVVFDTTDIDAELNYNKSSYTTPALETTGDGNKVLTNDGSYEYINNLALTNIKFKDGSNTSVYDLITEAITFQQDSTPCVSWSTTKNGNNIYMKLNIAKANSGMDGLLSKEDYVELNTTIPNQIEDLQNQGEELDNKINKEIQDRQDEVVRLDGRINQEIADRKSEISRVDTKYEVITDNLNLAIQLEVSDRKAADNTITNNLNAFINTKGQPGGLAELDSTGKVPAAQLPSYVDDVIEYPTLANFPAAGETGKIYVARDTNLTYRWSGNQYIEISKSLALGETSSTAYPGDKGKANRDALNSTPSSIISGFDTTTTTNELVKVNYKYTTKNGLNYSQQLNANIDIPAATESSAGAMTSIDKTRLNHLHDEFGTLKNPGDKLNTLPDNLVTELNEVTRDAQQATINYKQVGLSQNNSYSTPASRTTVIPAATSTLAGLMTSADKTQFDRVDTANFTLNNVTTDANTASINATKTNISTGTNSANNITIPAVTTSKAGIMTAADKVNLDTTIPNRITTLNNRVTTEVNNLTEKINDSASSLTDTMNTELAKKVGKVTVAGSGNAVTTASISGDTLTLTKGATYNNYVHPAGSAPSKSTGFYKFSTDSTSHIASVNAVTKDDITGLGIASSSDVTANATDLSNHINDSTAHITSAERTKWDKVVTDFDAITGNDSDEIINKWEEVVAFLDNYTEADTLSGLLSHKADKTVTISAGAGLTGGGDLSANRTLSLATSGVIAGTYTKMTVDQYGRVTAGGSLSANDVPGLPWAKITSGKPTTLAGYGITDAYTKTESNANFVTSLGTSGDYLTWVKNGVTNNIAVPYAFRASSFYTSGIDYTGSHVDNLKNFFDNYKTTIPRDTALSFFSNAYGNGSQYLGYFLHDYDDNPYGGFFVAHYNMPYYVGITNGTYRQQVILTDINYASTLDSRYVNVTGDTMGGLLRINCDYRAIELNSAQGESLITMMLNGTAKSAFGYNSNANYGAYMYNYSSSKYLGIRDNGTPYFDSYTLWHAGNDGSGSGLDADLLDGYDSSWFQKVLYDYYPNDKIPDTTLLPNILSIDTSIGSGFYFFDTKFYHNVTTNDARTQVAYPYAENTNIFVRRKTDGGSWTSWSKVAYTSDNVASASRLANYHTFWGQSFNGEQNVSGNITDVSNIYMSGYLLSTRTGTGYTVLDYHGDGSLALNYGLATNLGLPCIIYGNVGIDTISPSYKLDVNGTIHASDKISSPAGFWKESDIRLKSDIKPLNHTLDQICSIPTDSFIMNNTKQIGTIALELESIGFDELVSEDKVSINDIANKDAFDISDNDEYVKVKKVEYEMLSVIAIEGIKLLKDEIDKLKAELKK